MKDSYLSYKNIITIAYPIMLGSLGQNIINLIDTGFLGRVGQVELGAGALAGIFYFVMFMVGYAFNNGMQIIISRRMGEGKKSEVGNIVDHEFYLLIFIAVLEFVFLYFLSPVILAQFIQSKEILNATITFLTFRAFGIFFGLFNSCLQQFFIGIGKTSIINFSTVVLAVSNIILAYLLIFGHHGFPKMGIGGAALASTISEGIVMLVYIIVLYQRKLPKEYNLFRFLKPDLKLFGNMVSLSLPLVFQQVISIFTWFIFFLLIEHRGEASLAVSNIIKSLYIFWAIPTFAFASTANAMTSNIIGQGKEDQVIYLLKKITGLNFLISFVMCLALFIFPATIISIYTDDIILIKSSMEIIPVIVAASLLFSVALIVILTVTGTGSSRFALLMELVSISIYLIYAFVTAKVFMSSLKVIWGAEILYWLCAIIMGLLFLKYGKWKKAI
ncbi:MATE family efflux transporter [Bacteroidota bacterium]|nr:MATE family efflux transporter [Bacteroidota bacterium]